MHRQLGEVILTHSWFYRQRELELRTIEAVNIICNKEMCVNCLGYIGFIRLQGMWWKDVIIFCLFSISRLLIICHMYKPFGVQFLTFSI